jgi:hypothetical protein
MWYEVCESVVTNWRELPAEKESEKVMLIFLFILLGIMLITVAHVLGEDALVKCG